MITETILIKKFLKIPSIKKLVGANGANYARQKKWCEKKIGATQAADNIPITLKNILQYDTD